MAVHVAPHPSLRRDGTELYHEARISIAQAALGTTITVPTVDGEEEVEIKPGTQPDTVIRLRGKGEQSPFGGQAGDLLITIHVGSHPLFQRTGKNLQMRLPVTLAEAALGAKVDVPLPNGKQVSLRIPPGTSSGKKLRVKGQGVTTAKGEPGDLLVEVQIAIPTTLDEESLALIRQFDERNPLEPRRERARPLRFADGFQGSAWKRTAESRGTPPLPYCQCGTVLPYRLAAVRNGMTESPLPTVRSSKHDA